MEGASLSTDVLTEVGAKVRGTEGLSDGHNVGETEGSAIGLVDSATLGEIETALDGPDVGEIEGESLSSELKLVPKLLELIGEIKESLDGNYYCDKLDETETL